MRSPWNRSRYALTATAFGLVLLLAASARPAAASLYVIVTTADDLSGNSNCTLREAIQAATTNLPVDQCPAGGSSDEIVLAVPGVYLWTLGEATFGSSELFVHGAAGLPPASYTVNVTTANRFLRITSGANVVLENFKVMGGNALAAMPPRGGAVLSEDSDLALVDMVISNSSAGNGGGLYFSGAGKQLVVRRSVFDANHAVETGGQQAAGGGAYVLVQGSGGATISDSRFQLNDTTASTTNAHGGGLTVFGTDSTLVVRRCTFAGNEVHASGTLLGTVAALEVTSLGAAAGPVLLEDVAITGSAVVGGNAFTGNILALYAAGNAVTLRRVRVLGSTGPSGQGVQAQVETGGSGTIRLEDVLVARGQTQGLSVVAQGTSATVLVGHVTVTGHATFGLRLFAFGGSTGRLENSLLYGNGTDLDTGATPIDVAPENLVGIDPLFVDPVTDNYDLQAASPAVDTGNRTYASVGPFDVFHRQRVIGANTDLGAIERGGVFADGFESGDTGAWAAPIP